MNTRGYLIFLMSALVLFFAFGCDKPDIASEKPAVEKSEPKPIVKEQKMEDKAIQVKLETSLGDIVIELDEEKAPVTVKNFLQYVEEDFYNGTIFHRVIKGFMIQGGGFTDDMSQKKVHPPIVNEASNGLENLRGTIAMARTNNPNSATAQFFINHADNGFLNYQANRNPGYAVFGKVVQGLDTLDAIASVQTTVKAGMQDVPAETVTIKSATLVK